MNSFPYGLGGPIIFRNSLAPPGSGDLSLIVQHTSTLGAQQALYQFVRCDHILFHPN